MWQGLSILEVYSTYMFSLIFKFKSIKSLVQIVESRLKPWVEVSVGRCIDFHSYLLVIHQFLNERKHAAESYFRR